MRFYSAKHCLFATPSDGTCGRSENQRRRAAEGSKRKRSLDFAPCTTTRTGS